MLRHFGDGLQAPCTGCGKPLTDTTMTIDRYPVPGRDGGKYIRGNVRPMCHDCNTGHVGEPGWGGFPMTPHPREYSPDDIDYGIDGQYYGIYDGVVIWVLKDGRRVNRFRGFGDSRESRTDNLLATLAAADAAENPSGVGL